jgi:DNA uptake protein ComE-like DNA-binding protein
MLIRCSSRSLCAATLAIGSILSLVAAPAAFGQSSPQKRPTRSEQARIEACDKQADEKKLTGDIRKGYVSLCLTGGTAVQASAGKVNINSASPQELESRLPKLEAGHLQALIRSRPYKTVEELTIRRILPKPVYEGIREMITVR